MEYIFLIMALNEEKFIEKTFRELKTCIKNNKIFKYKIFIIDDGSTDKTTHIIKKIKRNNKNVFIKINKKNLGLATNIKNFIKKLKEGKFIVISGDNDLDTKLINNLLKSSKRNDLVLSYFLNREAKGYYRALISTLFNFICCTLFGVYAFYLQGPFVWPIKELKKIKIFSNGIAYVSEVNIKLLKQGIKFSEVPGDMNTGSVGSTSLKLANFIDIFLTISHLLFEIHIKKKFNLNPIRNREIY